MALAQRITALAQAIAQDFKTLGNRISTMESQISESQSSALIDGGSPSTSATDILKIDFGGIQ